MHTLINTGREKAKGQLLGQKASQVNKTQTICLTASLTMCAYITALCVCACVYVRVCVCVTVCVCVLQDHNQFAGLSRSLCLRLRVWVRVCCSIRQFDSRQLQHCYSTHTHTHVNSMCLCACLELRLLLESHSAFAGFFIGPIEAVYRRMLVNNDDDFRSFRVVSQAFHNTYHN